MPLHDQKCWPSCHHKSHYHHFYWGIENKRELEFRFLEEHVEKYIEFKEGIGFKIGDFHDLKSSGSICGFNHQVSDGEPQLSCEVKAGEIVGWSAISLWWWVDWGGVFFWGEASLWE